MKQGHKDVLMFIFALIIVVVGLTALIGAGLKVHH